MRNPRGFNKTKVFRNNNYLQGLLVLSGISLPLKQIESWNDLEAIQAATYAWIKIKRDEGNIDLRLPRRPNFLPESQNNFMKIGKVNICKPKKN